MRALENPTTYFFKQMQSIVEEPSQQIQDFASQLIDFEQCPLCEKFYDLLVKVPRIMIHCGHTFCTPCLKKNRRVRCPMCLKLVKQLSSIQRLPINHKIFENLVEKDKIKCKQASIKPFIDNASKYLFAEFQKTQKGTHLKEKPQRIDPDSGLPFCVFHPDRVQHFYCTVHQSAGCRVCFEIAHSKPECKVVDSYELKKFYLKPQTANITQTAKIEKQKLEMVMSGESRSQLFNKKKENTSQTIIDQILLTGSDKELQAFFDSKQQIQQHVNQKIEFNDDDNPQ